MRVGLLRDWTYAERPGEAERATELLARAAPSGVEIVPCPPGAVVEGCDLYWSTNVQRYPELDLNNLVLNGKPHVRQEMSWWQEGPTARLSRTLAETAAVTIFASPLHQQYYLAKRGMQIDRPNHYIALPYAYDAEACKATPRPEERQGLCYYGEVHPHLGVDLALRVTRAWLKEYNKERERDQYMFFDVYGPLEWTFLFHPWSRYQGVVPDYGELLAKVAEHEWLLYHPRHMTVFGMPMVEAQALGLKVHASGVTGVESWLDLCTQGGMEELAEKCELAPSAFWDIVARVAC